MWTRPWLSSPGRLRGVRLSYCGFSLLIRKWVPDLAGPSRTQATLIGLGRRQGELSGWRFLFRPFCVEITLQTCRDGSVSVIAIPAVGTWGQDSPRAHSLASLAQLVRPRPMSPCQKTKWVAGQMAQWVELLAAKPDTLLCTPFPNSGWRKLQAVAWHMHGTCLGAHTSNKCKKKIRIGHA